MECTDEREPALISAMLTKMLNGPRVPRALWIVALLPCAVSCTASDTGGGGGAAAHPAGGAGGDNETAGNGGASAGAVSRQPGGGAPVGGQPSGGDANGGLSNAGGLNGAGANNAGNAGVGGTAASGSAGSAGSVLNGGGSASGGCSGLFCEDFESGAINPGVWNVKTSGGQTVVIQKTKAAHGSYAAQFHALPNVLSYDLLITKNAPPGLRGHHFGRAYFYVTPKPPAQHTTLLWAGSSGFPTFKRLEVATINAGFQLTSVNQTGINSGSAALPGTTETYSAGGNLPVQQWICLEWEFNDAPDQARVFVNGTDSFDFTNIVLDGKSTGQVGGFSDFGFGFYAWHPASYVFDVYYDDIVLDTKRVGCLP
jgi:hypothetical protein